MAEARNVKRTVTQKFSALEQKDADELFTFLVKNLPWHDGVRTKAGKETRKAYALDLRGASLVDGVIMRHVHTVLLKQFPGTYQILGVYVNYLRDENDYVPSHKHDTVQLVISLGATRTLTVGKKAYPLESGAGIIFGRANHGVAKEVVPTKGRISIAVFLK